ncbi:MAG TPA: ABC transporter substrate-binding protein [Candidatus Binatia bacterium]|nr:ABC transporter substrate-binding protein [Candidatus Binatia bacterium]
MIEKSLRKRILRLALGAMLFGPCALAEAQQAANIPRIGMLRWDSPSNPVIGVFREELRNVGYVEGKNILFEYRFAKGKIDRLPDLAAELVSLKVDILVAAGGTAARVAKNMTRTIPIIMVGVGVDPVATGLVESLGRPGGNVTGFTLLAVETSSKRPELLKEAVPKLADIAVLYNPDEQGNLIEVDQVQTAARLLGVTMQSWKVRGVDDLGSVFAAIGKQRPDGVYVAGGPLMNANENRIVSFALKSRLPSVYDRKEAVEAGGLMSYGTDRMHQYRRAAIYVDKILKGAKPADLPVEQPKKFEFVINLKTAKLIGLTIPPNVLARADRVIR